MAFIGSFEGNLCPIWKFTDGSVLLTRLRVQAVHFLNIHLDNARYGGCGELKIERSGDRVVRWTIREAGRPHVLDF